MTKYPLINQYFSPQPPAKVQRNITRYNAPTQNNLKDSDFVTALLDGPLSCLKNWMEFPVQDSTNIFSNFWGLPC